MSVKAQLEKLQAKIKKEKAKVKQLQDKLQEEEKIQKNHNTGKKKVKKANGNIPNIPNIPNVFNHNKEDKKEKEEKTREWFADLTIYTDPISYEETLSEVINGKVIPGLPHLRVTEYDYPVPLAPPEWSTFRIDHAHHVKKYSVNTRQSELSKLFQEAKKDYNKNKNKDNAPIPNHRYYQEEISHYYVEMDSEVNLSTLYPKNHVIRVWNGNQHTAEFLKFIEDCYGSQSKIDLLKEGEVKITSGTISQTIYSIFYKMSYIKVNSFSLQKHSQISNVAYFHKVKGKGWKDSTTEPKMYHPYISYTYNFTEAKKSLNNIFLPELSEYLKDNYIPNACGYTLIIKKVKASWDAHYKKQKNPAQPPLTYELLQKIFQTDDEYGLTPETMINNFFKPFKLQLRLYDRYLNPLPHCSYYPEKKNKNITGAVYAIFTDGHFFELNHDRKKLELLDDEKKSQELTVSNRFYIPKVEEHKILTKLCKQMGMKPSNKGIVSKVEMIKFLESKDLNLDHLHFNDREYIWLPDIDMWKDIDFSALPSTTKVPTKELNKFLESKGEMLINSNDEDLLALCLQLGYTIPRGRDYNLLTPVSLSHLNQFLIHEMKIIPKVISRGGNTYSSLLLKIGDVRVRFVNPPMIEMMIHGRKYYDFLKYDNQAQVNEYNRFHKKMSEALINKGNLSRRFVEDPIQLRNYAPKALVGKLNNTIGLEPKATKATHKVDISKCYTWAMLNLPHFAVTGSFDRWYPITSTTNNFHKYYFYLVKRTTDFRQLPIPLKIILAYNYTIYSGHVLTYPIDAENEIILYDLIQPYCEIIGYMTVSGHTTTTKLKKVIKEIADSKLLTEKQKKTIWVENVGMIEKTENKKQEVSFFINESDAIYHAQSIDGSCFRAQADGAMEFMKLYKQKKFYYAPGDHNDPSQLLTTFEPSENHEEYPPTYMVRKKASTALITGFYPIKLDVYGLARIREMQLCEYAMTLGTPISILTDAIYFKAFDENLADTIKTPNMYNSIGNFVVEKVKSKEICPSNIIGDPTKDQITGAPIEPTFLTHKNIKTVQLQNEKYWQSDPDKFLNEVYSLVEKQLKTGNVMFLGTTAGTGKSFLAIAVVKYLISKGFRVKSMALANKRVKDLKNKGLDASTLHSAFKMRLDEDKESIDPDEVDTKDVDILFIDEVYMLQMGAYSMIRKIQQKGKVKMIFTGDVDQQKIIQVKVKNVEAYYQEIVESFVSFGIMLTINKRMKLEIDQIRYMELKSMLRDHKPEEVLHIPDYLNTFQTVEELFPLFIINGVYKGQILCYHQDTVYKVNQILHAEVLKYITVPVHQVKHKKLYVGMEIVNKCNRRFGDTIIYTNFSYIITYIDPKKRVKPKNGKESFGVIRIVPIEQYEPDTISLNEEIEIPFVATVDFAYPYATTMMSSQGDTYDDVPIAIFDIDSQWCTWNSIHTSIGRTNELKNIYMYLGTSFHINEDRLKKIISTRISQHQKNDTEHKREFNKEDYVDLEWVLYTMKESHLCCPRCRCVYNFFEDSSKNKFSIERIQDNLAHIKTNCVVYCLSCNESKVKLL